MTTKLSLRGQESDEIRRQLASFGARLRELRRQRGLTLTELSAQSNLSKAFLSRLESGDRQASISAALTLCKIFRVSLASLFEPPVPEPLCTIIRSGDAVERAVNGLKYTPLFDSSRLFNVQPMRVKVSASRQGDEHYHHEGVEWLYVLRGKLTLSIGGASYDLDEDDAAHFESHLPHRLIAREGAEVEVLIVAAPSWNAGALRNIGERRSIPAAGMRSLPEKKAAPLEKGR